MSRLFFCHRISKKKRCIVAIVLALIAVLAVGGAYVYMNPAPIKRVINVITHKSLSGDPVGADKGSENQYRAETSYDGSGTASADVYAYPFDKGHGYYVSNLKYIAEDNDQFHTAYKAYTAAAQNFLTTICGTGYRSVSSDKDKFKQSVIKELPVGDPMNGYLADDYADMLTSWIEDNELQADVTFKTDTSLLYKDAYVYLRGELDVTSYNCKKGADSSEVYPDGLDMSRDGKYVVDIMMLYDSYNKKVEVDGFRVLGEVKE